MINKFSTSITKEKHLYIAYCLELDIASQGESIEEAIDNLKEAIELYIGDEDTDIELPTL